MRRDPKSPGSRTPANRAWLLLALLILAACKKPSFEENYRKGLESMTQENYAQARSLFTRAYLQSPDNLEVRYQLALTLVHLQQIKAAYELLLATEAKDHFQSSVSLPIRIELAKIFLGAKKYESAQARLLRVLEKDPHNVEARTVLATTLASQAQPEAAREQVDLLLALDPSSRMGRVLDATLDLLSRKAPLAEASLLEEVKLTGRSTESLVTLANFYQVTQQRPKAAELLVEIVQREPQNIAVRMQLGSLYAKMGDGASAERIFRQAGQIAPADPTAAMALPSYYVRIGDWPKAAAELESMVKKKSDAPTRSLLAAVYYRAGRRDEARKLAEQLVTQTADSGAHLLCGLIHLDAREYEAALLEFERVVRDQHDSAVAAYLMARASYGAGKEQVGVEQMERALNLNHELLPARLWLIDYYLKRGSADTALDVAQGVPENQSAAPEIIVLKALCQPEERFTLQEQTALQRALLARPQFILAYQNLGMTTLLRKYGAPLREQLEAMVAKSPEFRPAQTILVAVLEAQDPERAIAQMQKRVRANPKSTGDLLTLARLEIERGQLRAARATLNQAAQAQPENPEVMVRRAEVEADSGDFDAAARQMEALTARYPTASRAWSFKAILYQQHGDLDKARAFYQEALKYDRNNAVAANNLGLLLATSFHDPQGAVELAQRAHQLDPAKPEFTDTLGWTQYLAGNLPDALRTLGDAVRMKPGNAAFHFHLGMVQSRSGRAKEALSHLETALRLDPRLAEAGEIKSVIAALGRVLVRECVDSRPLTP
jgi:tetratricopeptide (TPR) repeat protein